MPPDARPMPAGALRRVRDLPGRRGWPLLGNTLQVKPARIHLDVEQWVREFGPLFRMRLGRHDQLVIADHELLNAAMRDRPEGFRRSPYTSKIGAAAPLGSAAKRAAMPFGSGPRMCPGRYLALLEMKMAMAMLLSGFDIEAVDTPDDLAAQERMAFTMAPVGLRMRLREVA